ncbi:MAG: hypothetical protein M3Q58_11700 [Bacteroidota bacterium]|nr:hypothetical protein [Bacteroidota bacterium]
MKQLRKTPVKVNSDVNEKHKLMSNEQLQDLVRWLTQQIDHTNKAINEANQSHNFGREAQYEGMRDAFIRCRNKLSINKLEQK